MSSYKKKIEEAKSIIESLKKQLLGIFWDTGLNEYNAERNFLSWLEEDTEYNIRNLKLKKADEKKFIRKIHQLFGEYSEVIPRLKKKN